MRQFADPCAPQPLRGYAQRADARPRRHQLRARRAARPSGPLGARPGRGDARGASVEVELFSFPPAPASTSPPPGACADCCGGQRFDLVHAHYGLPGWCARLAGARPLVVSFHGTDVRHPLVGPLSRRLARRVDLVAGRLERAVRRRGRPAGPARSSGLRDPALRPRTSAASARCRESRLGASSDSTPTAATCSSRPTRPPREARRPRRRAGRGLRAPSCSAAARSSPSGCRSGSTPRTPSLVTSDYEGFGLVCDRGPRLRGARPLDPGRDRALPPRRARGRLCAPFERRRLGARRRARHLDSPDPRVAGAGRAAALSSGAWRNGRSRPTATFSPPRNRFDAR